jgi:hypothetical protein
VGLVSTASRLAAHAFGGHLNETILFPNAAIESFHQFELDIGTEHFFIGSGYWPCYEFGFN